jgi:sugar lactone lactonase YvrE
MCRCWVALGRAAAVHRHDPDGAHDGIVELPNHAPNTNATSVAFGGTDGRDCDITTSWLNCEDRYRGTKPSAHDLPLPGPDGASLTTVGESRIATA